MFIPGENVSFRFTLPFYSSDVNKGYVTFYQDDRVILELSKNASSFKAIPGKRQCYVDVTLTQQQSLLFENDEDYYAQINLIVSNGSGGTFRCTSKKVKGSNGTQFKQEVVT